MDEHEKARAEQDVIATTESYGGPVDEKQLAEVYLAPSAAGETWTGSGDQTESAASDSHDGAAPDVTSDPAKTDAPGTDWTDEGGATPQGSAQR
ncbi:hypothetical protein ABIB25_004934 [Nakamurella sp. UYEF19]|uniref:hypothetical protein n=1 Tax=Nakamurella sp. UYEF19 TaxID=1756392 RepID=UPI0033917154